MDKVKDLEGLKKKYPNLKIKICGLDVKITNGTDEEAPSLEITLCKQLPLEEIFDQQFISFIDGHFFSQ